ncbi:MAG: DUF1501 domain-containing protein [Pirellulales bacterium]|nr:DUF1501 domain-containing protein [Pirellulales bacterium]
MQDLLHHFATPSSVFASRRDFLCCAGSGCGLLALAGILGDQKLLADETQLVAASVDADFRRSPSTLNPLAARPGHFPAKAKSVIWLFMNGGQSQVDTWDYKPELEKRNGKPLEGFDKNTGFFANDVGPLMRSPFKFNRQGESGTWTAEIFAEQAKHVDRMAFIHSCFTETNNHSPALFQINTGFSRMGFPCAGAWVTYGLGTENRSLPAFVVMYDTLGRGLPKGNASNWGAGFLPGVYQGTALNPQGAPINNLQPPSSMTAGQQRQQLDLIAKLNRRRMEELHPPEADLAARIESFELAYRMQMSAPEVFDLIHEPEHIHKLYGTGEKRCAHFAKQALLARRLVENGVRFVQIYSGGMENERSWDGHKDIDGNHRQFAGETDQPIAALLTDLHHRGLLDSTLVICCGEFGRLPISQPSQKPGRDHNPHAFTTWLAGGGVKGGVHYGETDEIGHKAVIDKVSINDLHATVLHLLGLDHEKLTYRHNGRNFRLTDVAGRVVKAVVA